MIEIYKTSIKQDHEAQRVKAALNNKLPYLHITFDLEDIDHILRIEGTLINTNEILQIVDQQGYLCKVLPDKICPKSGNTVHDMESFWDNNFIKHHTMWGFEPSESALLTKDFFIKKNIKDILIPGIGYGRNANIFLENNIRVTGIEISKAAIEIGKSIFGNQMHVHHGSVTDMPFDKKQYEGIFCHGLLYLLTPNQRKALIDACYQQLAVNGWMVFSVLSTNSPNYGRGNQIDTDTFEIAKGGQLYFYNEAALLKEFKSYGCIDFIEIDEQVDKNTQKGAFKFYIIRCKKT